MGELISAIKVTQFLMALLCPKHMIKMPAEFRICLGIYFITLLLRHRLFGLNFYFV